MNNRGASPPNRAQPNVTDDARPAAGLRLQLLVVALTSPILQILVSSTVFFLIVVLLPASRLPAALYLLWIYVDHAPRRGGWRWSVNKARSMWFWKYVQAYFPATLVKTAELSPDRSYIFGYHPHGVISCGALLSFGTYATGFRSLFPGLAERTHVLGAKPLFKVPFVREWLMAHGGGSCGRRTCNMLLQENRSILLVVGGAREALEAHPNGDMVLTILHRKGFVRLAIKNNAPLVPVLSVGENELFKQLPNRHGGWLRWIQEEVLRLFGFTLPSFFGVGSFPIAANMVPGSGSLKYGILPFRRPLKVVVGAPIEVPSTHEGEDEAKRVDRYHALYLGALRKLYDEHVPTTVGGAKPKLVFK